MTDYGHDIEFALFVSPEVADIDRTLAIAQAADEGGVDLLTVQDHPYVASHLDALTLLAVVAARTTRLRVAANVANLPLRSPLVLAKSVASLDRLSGGRAELGIGAGGMWDLIEAAGGHRLTPGEAVTGLEEAIRLVRGLWRGTGSVRVDGTVHRLAGLHSGPAPAHDVSIWVGGYKPRMLGLVGRLADGWWPSLGYVQPEQLGELNARIDDAAGEAGRHPADVRRLLNLGGPFGGAGGSVREQVDQLAGLALDEGVGTFVIAPTDVDDVRRLGEEVAPAVRELVAAERTTRA